MPERAKSEFRKLGITFTMRPVYDEGPRPFLRAEGSGQFEHLAFARYDQFTISGTSNQNRAGSRTFVVDLPPKPSRAGLAKEGVATVRGSISWKRRSRPGEAPGGDHRRCPPRAIARPSVPNPRDGGRAESRDADRSARPLRIAHRCAASPRPNRGVVVQIWRPP